MATGGRLLDGGEIPNSAGAQEIGLAVLAPGGQVSAVIFASSRTLISNPARCPQPPSSESGICNSADQAFPWRKKADLTPSAGCRLRTMAEPSPLRCAGRPFSLM